MVRPQESSWWIDVDRAVRSARADNAMRVAREEVRSGIGREKGLEALRHDTQTKTVIAHVDDRA